jgi:hypothetical protein
MGSHPGVTSNLGGGASQRLEYGSAQQNEACIVRDSHNWLKRT